MPIVLLCSAAPCVSAAFAPPRGIYSLGPAIDNPGTPQDERLAGIRDYDFVSGYTLRVLWQDLEPSQGVYNFAVIDEAIRRVGSIGQRLNLEVMPSAPAHVTSGAAAQYTNARGEATPVPWDTFAQSRFAALQTAMATHVVDDGSGISRTLNQHPTLAAVDATPTGLNLGVRDLNNAIRTHADYTQQRYISAVVQGVRASRDAFPNHQGQIAFFGFNDGQPGTPVDQQLIAQLAAEYNGPGEESLAFFIENLSDIGPVPIGGSGGTGNNLLLWTALGGSTMMQALDSWVQHSPDREPQLASRNPATGISLGYNAYGTRFFELYTADLDQAMNGALDAVGRPILDDLRFWHVTLVPAPGAAGILFMAGAIVMKRRRRAAVPRSHR